MSILKKLFSELVSGRMECQCRKDMQWNRDALECQVMKINLSKV